MSIGSDYIVLSGAVTKKKIFLCSRIRSGYFHWNSKQLSPLSPNNPHHIKLLACSCVSVMLLPGEAYGTVLRFSASASPHKNGTVFCHCWF